MIVAAHQPNYLPWLGFFAKMLLADVFVLADDVQYTKHSFINRNRIKNAEGWQWLTVPVYSKGRLGQLIREVEINNVEPWARRHWKSIQVNYRHAAYFDLWADELQGIYSRRWTRLVDLNLALIEFARRALSIDTPVVLSSELGIRSSGTDRLVEITQAVGGSVYLSGRGAADYVDERCFEDAGLEHRYMEFRHPVYHQLFGPFIANLSILDLLLNEGDQSRAILQESCHPKQP
jgi:hypothetical protein